MDNDSIVVYSISAIGFFGGIALIAYIARPNGPLAQRAHERDGRLSVEPTLSYKPDVDAWLANAASESTIPGHDHMTRAEYLYRRHELVLAINALPIGDQRVHWYIYEMARIRDQYVRDLSRIGAFLR